jgi:pyridoxine 5-phosphate synthase
LDVLSNEEHLSPFINELQEAKIRVSIFVDPDINQIEACHRVGVDLIEINTGKYAELKPGEARNQALKEIKKSAQFGHKMGLEIHAGHGLDYKNVEPVADIPEITEFSIGFAIVARAAMVGIERAVEEMIVLIK